jgi:hypothetical protein
MPIPEQAIKNRFIVTIADLMQATYCQTCLLGKDLLLNVQDAVVDNGMGGKQKWKWMNQTLVVIHRM